ncbi:uncharacterized protein QC763_0030400 [Podospora pseudopauciseta]|uniref:Uncharacterized protein n=1 Tax=Podospora pseudopauciseta TaxID=2093780 RepID=A0ABR0HMV3_9PEZI|nr:hypothetical protein QC763_0030400 [Podospora pseudopauciseta]
MTIKEHNTEMHGLFSATSLRAMQPAVRKPFYTPGPLSTTTPSSLPGASPFLGSRSTRYPGIPSGSNIYRAPTQNGPNNPQVSSVRPDTFAQQEQDEPNTSTTIPRLQPMPHDPSTKEHGQGRSLPPLFSPPRPEYPGLSLTPAGTFYSPPAPMPKPSTYQALPKDDIPANSKMNAASSNHTSTTGLPPNIFAAPAKGSGLSEVEKKETKETNPESVAAMEKPEAGTVVEWKGWKEWAKKKKKKKKKDEEKKEEEEGEEDSTEDDWDSLAGNPDSSDMEDQEGEMVEQDSSEDDW